MMKGGWARGGSRLMVSLPRLKAGASGRRRDRGRGTENVGIHHGIQTTEYTEYTEYTEGGGKGAE
mgnify:CR=1 FL=1